MKSLLLIAGASVVAVVIAFGGSARSADNEAELEIIEAVASTTTVVEGSSRISQSHPERQVELARALSDHGDSATQARHKARCYYNCSPPVGSVTASPNVVDVPADALGSVTIHWRWEQSSTQEVSRHGCLWVSGRNEIEAHQVQCELASHTYVTNVGWIGVGSYVFRVAPGNPEGPYTKPVAGLYQLAQAIVIGVGADSR
jgi:hypothetical protein